MYHTKTVKGGCHIRPVLFCGDVSKVMEEKLSSYGLEILRLPKNATLPEPISRHPDTLMAELPSGKLLVFRAYYEENRAILEHYARFFEFCNDTLGEHYPDDTKLNALKMENTLFCGKAVSKTLAERYEKIVTVKQGYARCAAAKIGRGIVTADPSLHKALVKEGIDTLLISSGHILLKPYDTGFIGGASLTLSESLTVFFGKIEDHPDYPAILAFAQKQNSEILSLSDEPLSDLGGGYLLYDETT